MIPRRVRLAILIAFLGHGLFIVTARYRLSYDGFTHMLFAEHYAEHWFSLWESRWYTGFTVVTYPPLIHQLIAIFIPALGFDKAYALILWLVTTLYPLGIYTFCRIFIGKTSASYAALSSALLLPIYVTAYIFGQLPFLASTLLALFSAASLNQFLNSGGLPNFLLTVSLYTTTMAAHHATVLMQPFLIFAVILKILFDRHVEQSSQPTPRSISELLRFSLRLIPFFIVAGSASLLVIYPFWQWGSLQALQAPIDHLSRHNFFTEPLAVEIFFLPLYGPFLFIMPFVFSKWPLKFLGLQIAFITLFVLGLGGTTPLPRLIFGSAWEWLTYDRFAFWACLTLTPFFGILFIRMKKKVRTYLKQKPVSFRDILPSALTFSLFTITALGAWFTPWFIRLQPDLIDMQPIVNFLNTDNRSQYRYLTFGFGDQFANLNLLTQATTIDGSYHTARSLPELRSSGLGQIDTAYWALNGMTAINPILQKSGEYGVRWGFVNSVILQKIKFRWGYLHANPYIPVLQKLGWKPITKLDNGVIVFENPNALLPKPSTPPATAPITSFVWGIFPMASLITSLALSGLRVYPVETERILTAIYKLTVSLLPISLGFWIFQPIASFPQNNVYFTYTDALFFFSDGLIVLSLISWVSKRLFKRAENVSKPYPLLFLFSIFCLLAIVSTLWSHNQMTTFYVSIHFLIIFLFILSLMDNPQVWNLVSFGLSVSLVLQFIIGWCEFALQSTAFLDGFNMQFPGMFDATYRGVSVVQLENGLRILRAYGTLPHPNILGGLSFLSILGPASLYLEKQNRLALILLGFGIILLTLTFSRSAWLAFVIFLFVLAAKAKYFNIKRLFTFLSVSLVSISMIGLTFHDMVFTRISNSTVTTEHISMLGRSWLADQAWSMFKQHPFFGVGIGSFVIELSRNTVEGALIEPVHNLFMLAGTELGIIGVLVVAGIFISIGYYIFQSTTPKAILAGATVSGLGVISLFDHYQWSVAPGRIMFAFAIGLWLGQFQHGS